MISTIDEIDMHLKEAQEWIKSDFRVKQKEADKHIQIARNLLEEISLSKVLPQIEESIHKVIKETAVALKKDRCPKCGREL